MKERKINVTISRLFFEKKKPTNSSAAKEKIMQYDSLKENIDQQSRKSESKNFKNPNLEKS